MGDNLYGHVDSTLSGVSSGWRAVRVSPSGELAVRDFWMDCALEGRAYQVRLGTITTAITGDQPVADTAAEAAVNAPNGITVIPSELHASLTVNLGAPNMIFMKSAPTASAVGTGAAFTPLNLLTSGSPSQAAAFTGTAGSVTAPAELATTTRRIFNWTSPGVTTAATNPNSETVATVGWNPTVPSVVQGTTAASATFYLQIGATGTAPTYFAHFNYVELDSSVI